MRSAGSPKYLRRIRTNTDHNDMDLDLSSTYTEIDRMFKSYCKEHSNKSSNIASKKLSTIINMQNRFMLGKSATSKVLEKHSSINTKSIMYQNRSPSISNNNQSDMQAAETDEIIPSKTTKSHFINSFQQLNMADDHLEQVAQEYGISLDILSRLEDPEERHRYVVKCMKKCMNDDLKEFNKKHNARTNIITSFESQYHKSKDSMQNGSADIFSWLNIKTPHGPLKKKLRSRLAETVNDQDNQSIIETTLEDIKNSKELTGLSSKKKIMLENIPVIDNNEILKRMLQGRNENIVKVTSNKKNPPENLKGIEGSNQINDLKTLKTGETVVTKQDEQDEDHNHAHFEWNENKESEFRYYRENARSRLFDKINSSNWLDLGFSPSVQDTIKEEKSKQQRDKILSDYMNGDLLTPDEYKLLASTSVTLNKFVDRNYLQTVISHVDPDVIEAIETDIAENTLKDYEHRQKEMRKVRLDFLKDESERIMDKISKKNLIIEKNQRTAAGKAEHSKITQRAKGLMSKMEERRRWRKEDSKNKTTDGDKSPNSDANLKLIANKFLDVVDKNHRSRKAENARQFLKKLVPTSPKSNLLDVSVSRHHYHPSSKLMVSTQGHDTDYLGLGTDFFNPGLPKRKNENASDYKLNIHTSPEFKVKKNFRKFYSGGPKDEDDRIFQGNYILGDVNKYRADDFKLQVILKIQAAWRGYKGRLFFKQIQEKVREKAKSDLRKLLIRSKSGQNFAKSVLSAHEKAKMKAKNANKIKAYLAEKDEIVDAENSNKKGHHISPRAIPRSKTALTAELKRPVKSITQNISIQDIQRANEKLTSDQRLKYDPSQRSIDSSSLNDLVDHREGNEVPEYRSKKYIDAKRPKTALNRSNNTLSNLDDNKLKHLNTRNMKVLDPGSLANIQEEEREMNERMNKILTRAPPKGLLLKHRKLLTAAKTNNYNVLLNSGFIYYEMDVNIKDEKGNTPLYYAAKNGSKELCEFLAQRKAYVNMPCTDGNTPLHMAFASGQIMIVIMLISHGGNLNVLNDYGQTPVAFGNDSMLNLLDLRDAVATYNGSLSTKMLPPELDNNYLLQRFKPKNSGASDFLTLQYNSPGKTEGKVVLEKPSYK